jgi:hypothetical protein
MIESYQIDKKRNDIICIHESGDQSKISIRDYFKSVVGVTRYIDLKNLNRLYNDINNSYLFSPIRYVIEFTTNVENRHFSYSRWCDAYEMYCKMINNELYQNIKTNFDTDYTLESAQFYNNQLKKNTKNDNKSYNINRIIDIDLLD